jgi:hypothetical protein
MTRPDPAISNAARGVWVRAVGDAPDAGDLGATTTEVWNSVRAGLERWVGVAGYCALLERALGIAREHHPWLGSIAVPSMDEATLRTAVQTLGSGEVAAGMVALLTALIDLLARIIGDEMAIRLVEQVGAPSPRGVVSNTTEKARNG